MSDSAYIQKAQKKLPYTITPIANLNAWKVERSMIEDKWQKDYAVSKAEARARAVGMVEAGVREALAQRVSEAEAAETDHIDARARNFKRQEEEFDPLHFTHSSTWEDRAAPRASQWQKFKTFMAQQWRNAFSGE